MSNENLLKAALFVCNQIPRRKLPGLQQYGFADTYALAAALTKALNPAPRTVDPSPVRQAWFILQQWLENNPESVHADHIRAVLAMLTGDAPDVDGALDELDGFMIDNVGEDELWEDAFPEIDEARALLQDIPA